MAKVSVQPDSQTQIQRYLAYLDSQECTFQGHCKGFSAIYAPRSSLLGYFTRHGNSIDQLLTETLQNVAHTIPEGQFILDSYVVVFTILLKINGAQHLPHFIGRKYNDESLPFFDKPRHFPKTQRSLFEDFFDAQWRFCPVQLPKDHFRFDLEPEQILPVSEKHKIAERAVSLTYRANLHPDYDSFVDNQNEDFDISGTSVLSPRTYIFREFTSTSRAIYEKELAVLISLRQSDHSICRIVNSFFGSFAQEGISTIILGYPQYVLEEYMLSVPPPTEDLSIARLWEGLLNIHEILYTIQYHDSTSMHRSRQSLLPQCWYKNLHPANLGIFYESVKGEHSFKFRLMEFCTDDESKENKAYSAPECSHAITLEYLDRWAADVWSLGCIFSEFAVWISLGSSGLQSYRASRNKATKTSDSHGIAPFHDGNSLLTCVSVWHNWAVTSKSNDDHVTDVVLQKLVEDMLWDDEDTRLKPRQLKMKINRLLLQARDHNFNFGERSESRSSGDTAVSSAALSNTSHESERPLLQNVSQQTQLPTAPTDTLVVPRTSEAFKTPSILDTGFQSPIEARPFSFVSSARVSKPLPKTLQDECRSSGDYRNSTAAPEVVPFQLQSQTSDLEHSLTSSTLVNGDDKEVVVSVVPALTTRQIVAAAHDQAQRNMLNASQGLAVYTPSLSLSDGLIWLNNKKGTASNAALRDESYLDDLFDRDFHFLVDNSASMRAHREIIAQAVRLLSWLLKKYDKHGIQLHFTRRLKSEYARQGHSSDLQKPLLKGLEDGRGQTDISSSVIRILKHFRDRDLPELDERVIDNILERGSKFVSAANKIMIYVITDGNWESGSEDRLSAEMRAIAKPLKMQGVQENGVGIQFLRVKENASVVAKLNRLKKVNFAERIKVDSQPLEGNIFRSLLGPITDLWDYEDKDT